MVCWSAAKEGRRREPLLLFRPALSSFSRDRKMHIFRDIHCPLGQSPFLFEQTGSHDSVPELTARGGQQMLWQHFLRKSGTERSRKRLMEKEDGENQCHPAGSDS
jgi:hypothetical protein